MTTKIWQIAALLIALTGTMSCNLLEGERTDVIQIQASQPFQLGEGDTAQIDRDTRLTFEMLKEDSRCPRRVLCIWEGEVDVDFMINTRTRSDSLNVKGFLGPDGEDPLQTVFGDYQLLIDRVDPYPGEGDPDDVVVVTLRVIPFTAMLR